MDVTGSSIDRAKRHVYFGLNDGGFTRLVVLDAATFARDDIPLPKDAEHVVAGGASLDGRFVTIGVESGTGAARELRLGLGARRPSCNG